MGDQKVASYVAQYDLLSDEEIMRLNEERSTLVEEAIVALEQIITARSLEKDTPSNIPPLAKPRNLAERIVKTLGLGVAVALPSITGINHKIGEVVFLYTGHAFTSSTIEGLVTVCAGYLGWRTSEYIFGRIVR